MLSSDGRCKTFDARANGYARSEGVGAFKIAVGCSSAGGLSIGQLYIDSRVRSDGKSASLTAPNGKAQAAMLRSVLAGTSARAVGLLETHGTGTALGDPIEVSGVARAMERAKPCLGSAKANLGHAEPSAGLLGLLALTHAVKGTACHSNAMLRILNPNLAPQLGHILGVLVTQTLEVRVQIAGVSSFGYSGTIAHALIAGLPRVETAVEKAVCKLVYQQRPYPWRDVSHPFLQEPPKQIERDGATLTYSSVSARRGAAHVLVADHVVQGQNVFPAAGYLEMANTASHRAASSTVAAATRLSSVFFLLPLSIPHGLDDTQVIIECVAAHGGSFTISSASASRDPQTHCSGNFTQPSPLAAFQLAHMRSTCSLLFHADARYEAFDHSGLNYGPSFRTLQCIWAASMQPSRTALLRRRESRQGTTVHPADVDGALQLSVASLSSRGSTLCLPFATDAVQLKESGSRTWAHAEAMVDGVATVTLTSTTQEKRSQLEGFKTRELRTMETTKEHDPWYAVDWCATELSICCARKDRRKLVVVIRDADRSPDDKELLKTFSLPDEVASTMARASAAIFASSLQCGALERHGLPVAAAALALLQSAEVTLPIWFFTAGVHRTANKDACRPTHAGPWGLARTARKEAMRLQLRCVDVEHGSSMVHIADLAMEGSAGDASDLELVLSAQTRQVSRLTRIHPLQAENIRVAFLPRGAISNLRIEPQPAFGRVPTSFANHCELRVRAVGLNFRDVLNVLGEYPGDPGPPGIDCAGVISVSTLATTRQKIFGLGLAALASIVRTDAELLASKPTGLTFEEASTLPTTWTTVHVALGRSLLKSRDGFMIQAAAGGVGLKAVEYAHWLYARIVVTAGGRNKHEQLRWLGIDKLCSSRDGATFSRGVATQLRGVRLHGALNSLSLDFIAASFAALCERAALQEIGKRSIWSVPRQAAAAACALYLPIAIDADTAETPAWMNGLLRRLTQRSNEGTLTSLPLRSFELETQVELAFRTLLAGLNTGKIVVRLAARGNHLCIGGHVITGGTGALGVLTARWLAEKGASRLVLASRSGKRAPSSAGEWALLMSVRAHVRILACNSAEDGDVQRLVSQTLGDVAGFWHAAGVLQDSVLSAQTAAAMCNVFSSKALGAWALQRTGGHIPQRACLLFSSVASLLGNPGQANYSSANACLDALSTCRRVAGLAASSVQWGPWAQAGMAVGARTSKRLEAAGFGFISAKEGLGSMKIAIRHCSPAVLGVVSVVWSRYLNAAAEVPAFLNAFSPLKSAKGRNGFLQVAGSAEISMDSILEMARRTAGGEVDADAPLMDAGIDSLGAVELRNQMRRVAGCHKMLPSTIVFDHPSIRSLVSFLNPAVGTNGAKRLVTHNMRSTASLHPAISGTSSAIPGGCLKVSEAWWVICTGSDVLCEVPASRWPAGGLNALPESIKVRCRHGGFLRGAHLFDNSCFRVSYSEAAVMDPQQRMLLEFGYMAFSSAGRQRKDLKNTLTAVYVGITTLDFNEILQTSPLAGTVYAATGSGHSIASGRISFALGMQGPCLSIDTACSAALVATLAASAEVLQSTCEQALAAGVNLILTPIVSSRFAMAGMTSPRGRCHSFDARADGYSRSEVCCSLALTTPTDPMVAMPGYAIRQDGRSATLTAPNGQAQQTLLLASLACSGVGVEALDQNEAHGTGTPLGDPIEMSSMVAAVMTKRDLHGALPESVSAVKANVGHAEAAAGMAGLLKLSAELQLGITAPNAQLRSLNSFIGDSLVNVSCSLTLQLDLLGGQGRLGGVSSFGYSGTIAHAVLYRAKIRWKNQGNLTPYLPIFFNRRSFTWNRHESYKTTRMETARSLPQRSGSRALNAQGVGALHAAANGTGQNTVSLADILEMVQRTAGCAPDADAPLMESGIDSLAAVELRNQLRSALGFSASELPSTIIFEHPTSRLLAAAISPGTCNTSALDPASEKCSSPPPRVPPSVPSIHERNLAYAEGCSTQQNDSERCGVPDSRRPRALMLHGRAADGIFMQRLLTVLGWASLPLELMTVTAVHPCDTRPDLYPSTVEFQNGAYDWGLTFDGPERIESLEQSIVDIERILIADIDPFDGIGGVCDGALIASLVAARLPPRSRPSFLINMCGGPWELLPKSLQTEQMVMIPSLHLIGRKDEIFTRDQLLDIPDFRCVNPFILIHGAGHSVPLATAAVSSAVEALVRRSAQVASACDADHDSQIQDHPSAQVPGADAGDAHVSSDAYAYQVLAVARTSNATKQPPKGDQAAFQLTYDSLALVSDTQASQSGQSGVKTTLPLAHLTGIRGVLILLVVLGHFVPRPVEPIDTTTFVEYSEVAKGWPVQDLANKLLLRLPVIGMPYLFVASGFGMRLNHRHKELSQGRTLFDFYLDRLTRSIVMMWLVISIELLFDRMPKGWQPYFQPRKPTKLAHYVFQAATMGVLRPVAVQVHNLWYHRYPWPLTYIAPTSSTLMNEWLEAYTPYLPTLHHLWFFSYITLCTLAYPMIAKFVRLVERLVGITGLVTFCIISTAIAIIPMLIDRGEVLLYFNGSSYRGADKPPADHFWTDEPEPWQGVVDAQVFIGHIATTTWAKGPQYRMPWFLAEPSVSWLVGYVLWFACGVATATCVVHAEEWTLKDGANASREQEACRRFAPDTCENDERQPLLRASVDDSDDDKLGHEYDNEEAFDFIEDGTSSRRKGRYMDRQKLVPARSALHLRAWSRSIHLLSGCRQICSPRALFTSHGGRGALADVCALVLLLAVLWQPYNYAHATNGYVGQYGFGELVNWNRAFVPIYCLFLYGSSSQGGSGRVAALFASNPLVTIGEISMAMYVLQATVARCCGVRWFNKGQRQDTWCKEINIRAKPVSGGLCGRVEAPEWAQDFVNDVRTARMRYAEIKRGKGNIRVEPLTILAHKCASLFLLAQICTASSPQAI